MIRESFEDDCSTAKGTCRGKLVLRTLLWKLRKKTALGYFKALSDVCTRNEIKPQNSLMIADPWANIQSGAFGFLENFNHVTFSKDITVRFNQ